MTGQPPFPSAFKDIAESMGIALYQLFTFEEAAEALKCTENQLDMAVQRNDLSWIEATDGHIQFFGYQLLQYLLDNVTGKPPKSSLPDERIIRAKEVQAMTGLSRTTIWRMEREDSFPKRISLGKNSVGWYLSDVQAWVRSRH